MNAIDMRKAGLTVRMRAIGERVRFRGRWIGASINRVPLADTPPGAVDIQTDEGATIVLPADQPEPNEGEVLRDDAGIDHRVGEVKWAAHGWHCRCMTNR